MSKQLIGFVCGMLLALPLAAAEPTTDPAAAPAAPTLTVEQQLVVLRDELQGLETEFVSKGVSLTTEEATAFWPVFKKFQAEQRVIIDGQIAAVNKYAADFATLSDDDAVAYVEALLDRDQKIHDLREKYLGEYAKVIGKNKAARVIHISRRLGLASQAKLASAIPLVR